jgi:4-carboxymuconolactone decarboxylase
MGSRALNVQVMDESTAPGPEQLGGRLPLLWPGSLDDPQHALYTRLQATRIRGAQDGGYTAMLGDGRLIGPFNAMIRAPQIAGPMLDWAQAIASAGLPADVREVVILTVGGLWHSEYVLYAHTAAAARAGVPGAAIGALRRGETPSGLRVEADAAHRLARAVIYDHEVPDDLYDQAIAILGTQTMITVLHLAGQYLTTSAVLACFQVPAPPGR